VASTALLAALKKLATASLDSTADAVLDADGKDEEDEDTSGR